jgi:ubiquinone/menaquinone biosynthesis C-methylase UbiE
MADRRRALLADAAGRVLEIGAGTGLNVPHYPQSVEDLVLVEPSRLMTRHLIRKLDHYRSRVRIVSATAEDLPFPDDSFDCVVASFVFCTVRDPSRSLRELARVTRPGGRFFFLEHVRASSGRLALWQDRLNPIWRLVANGCHCNRTTLQTFLNSEFAVIQLHRADWLWMPFTVRPTIEGRAVLSSSGESAAPS